MKPPMTRFRTLFIRAGLTLSICAAVLVGAVQHARAVDAFALLQKGDGSIHVDAARDLYLEKVRIKSHGIDFMNGCQKAKMNKHKRLPISSVPVIRYKGYTIVGSPYQSVPIKTGKNNNPVYFKRLKGALDIIEKYAPDSFDAISETMKQKNGYIIIDNMCPSDGGLAFAAFVPRKSPEHFVVMVSSTLLLVPDLFNDYDIASQLIHEMEGHAVDFYRRGTTDETNAFTQQARFAERVGNKKFKDVNNRAVNLRTKVKLKLSTTGTYVESK